MVCCDNYRRSCSSWPFSDTVSSSDGWRDYGCVNVRSCMSELLPDTEFISYDQFTISQITLEGRSGLYVDNLAFSRTPIEGMTGRAWGWG